MEKEITLPSGKKVLLKYKEELNEIVKNISFELNGYHRRFSNSTFISDKKTKCDYCDCDTNIKIGYEKDYPNNPDLGLCINCGEKLDNNHNLYSEIENLIIAWNIDGTKTAGHLTREILGLINNK